LALCFWARKSWQKGLRWGKDAQLMANLEAERLREKVVQGQGVPFKGMLPVIYFLKLDPTSK
jgi:hypothetical protein